MVPGSCQAVIEAYAAEGLDACNTVLKQRGNTRYPRTFSCVPWQDSEVVVVPNRDCARFQVRDV